jgi:hypothetical protein
MKIVQKEIRTSLIQIKQGVVIRNNTQEFTDRQKKMEEDAQSNGTFFIYSRGALL